VARICLIEDDALIRKTLHKLLSNMDHFVATASNGKEGLALIQSRPFDIVVTDIIMPEMEGIELIRRIHETHPDLKVVAMSGGGRVGNMDFLKIAKSIGADEIIYKPATKTDFINAIDRCLSDTKPG